MALALRRAAVGIVTLVVLTAGALAEGAPEPPAATAPPTPTWWLDPPSPPPGLAGYPGPVVLHAAAVDGGGGATRVEYGLGDAPMAELVGPLRLDEPGAHTVVLRAVDAGGNASSETAVPVRILEPDSEPPEVAIALDRPAGAASTVLVTVTARDVGWGLAGVDYRIGGGPWTPYTGALRLAEPGTHAVLVRARDLAGLEREEAVSVEVAARPAPALPAPPAPPVDRTPPTTTARVATTGTGPGWSRVPVAVSLAAADAAGVARTEYAVDGGGWLPYDGPVTVATEGHHRVLFRSVDLAGNAEPVRAVDVRVDRSAPVLVLRGRPPLALGDAGAAATTFAARDALSGVASLRALLDGRPVRPATLRRLYRLPLGRHRLTVSARDHAGNAASRSVAFRTHTSFGDLARLVRAFRREGRLTGASARRLDGIVGRARAAAAARHRPLARRELGRLAAAAAGVRDLEVRRVLVRDAGALGVRVGARASRAAIAANGGRPLAGAARVPASS